MRPLWRETSNLTRTLKAIFRFLQDPEQYMLHHDARQQPQTPGNQVDAKI